MASSVQDCDCGFIDSNDPTKNIFTSYLSIDFGSITSEELYNIFIPATYQVTQKDAPYTRNFTADRVALSSAGLSLTVSPPPDAKKVPCAQIFTRATTFFYGSYHAKFRVSEVPGTVTAFYNYKNDDSEVDIEYLSAWRDPTLLYTVKPQIYFDNGNPSNETYLREPCNGTAVSFAKDFHDWSYIWLPDIVHFGFDSRYTKALTTNVPRAPGKLAINHWSDGNPKYSLGPPTESSTVTVSQLWAVFNDTSAGPLTCKKTSSACTVTDGVFQSASGGGTNGGGAVIVTFPRQNDARGFGPAAPGWLFALFLLFSSFKCWRVL